MRFRSRWLVLVSAAILFFASPVAAYDWPYPSAERPWTPRDYTNFMFTHKDGNKALPHLRNAESRLIFERFVDFENVERLLASTRYYDDKKTGIAIIMAAVGNMRAAYNYQVRNGEPLQEELVRVQIFSLDVIGAWIDLSPSAIHFGSLSGRRDTWKTTLLGVVRSLSEQDIYSTEQVITLADALAGRYEKFHTILTTDEKQRLIAQLHDSAKSEQNKTLQDARYRLLRVVESY